MDGAALWWPGSVGRVSWKMQAHQLGVSVERPCISLSCSYRHSNKIKHRPAFPNRAAIRFRLDRAHYPRRKSVLHVVSTLEENIVESSAGTKVVKVKFVLQKKCEFGQQFNVVGDDELFGAWDPEASIPMQWSEGHIWTTEVDLSVGKRVEYKVILMGDQGVLEWQLGPNRVLETSEALSSFVILESWSGEEYILQNDAMEMRGLLNSQDLNEMATSQEPFPDLVEDTRGLETMNPAIESEGVNEEEIDEEVTVYTGPVEVNAEISESWSGEEVILQNDAPLRHVMEMSDLPNSQDLNEMATSQELLPDLVEDIGGVETVIPATESEGVNEEESDEELTAYNGPDEVNAEVLENESTNSAVEDSFEDLETKPSVLEKDLEWGRKALSMIWGALVQKGNNEAQW